MSEEGPARRGRARVGDETQARIDEIADGWGKAGDAPADGSASPKPATPASKPAAAPVKPPSAPAGKPAGAARPAKPRTRPPPPPGSNSSSARIPLPQRGKTTSAPPPIPGQRARKPPPPPPGARPKVDSDPAPEPPPRAFTPVPDEVATVPRTKPITANDAPSVSGSTPAIRAPVASEVSAAARKPRVVEASVEISDDDPTIIPTGDDDPGPIELRTPAALPRRSGLWGDMRYVFTVLFGLRRVRTELAETEAEIEAEKRSRDKELAELARMAIADVEIATPAVEEAREKLVELEEIRSKKAGAAAAVEETISTIKRERDKVAAERADRIAELEADIAELEAKIEPLAKQRADLDREIREFKERLDDYDRRIEAEEDKLSSEDTAVIVEAEAAIASLRAEREAEAAGEPELADKVAELEPALRDLKAQRGELSKSIAKLRRAEDESVVRSEERIAAASAHKLVVDRAAADMSREQTELLTDLGDRLYKRPPPSIARLALPIKERAVTLARLKDRATALAEERASVERLPIVRGVALWLVAVAAIAAGAYVALTF